MDKQYTRFSNELIQVGKAYEDFNGDKITLLHICNDEQECKEPFFVLCEKQNGSFKHYFVPKQAFRKRWDDKVIENKKEIKYILQSEEYITDDAFEAIKERIIGTNLEGHTLFFEGLKFIKL